MLINSWCDPGIVLRLCTHLLYWSSIILSNTHTCTCTYLGPILPDGLARTLKILTRKTRQRSTNTLFPPPPNKKSYMKLHVSSAALFVHWCTFTGDDPYPHPCSQNQLVKVIACMKRKGESFVTFLNFNLLHHILVDCHTEFIYMYQYWALTSW